MGTSSIVRWPAVVLACVVVGALCCAAPREASSAADDDTPPVRGPSRASLAASTPLFTWDRPGSSDPVLVESIQIDPRTAWSDETTFRIAGLVGKSAARTPRAISAGRYRWRARYAALDGTVAAQSPWRWFTIAQRVTQVRVVDLDQVTFDESVELRTSFRTNVPTADVTCTITHRGSLVDEVVHEDVATNIVTYPTWVDCEDLVIPESLDGRRLRATITVTAGQVTATGALAFIAK